MSAERSLPLSASSHLRAEPEPDLQRQRDDRQQRAARLTLNRNTPSSDPRVDPVSRNLRRTQQQRQAAGGRLSFDLT